MREGVKAKDGPLFDVLTPPPWPGGTSATSTTGGAYLKSGCPLTSAVTLDAAGEPYDGCTDWGQAVSRLLAHPRRWW